MNRLHLKKLVMTALFAALICAATMVIRIPTPGTGGYIHPGDALVIISGAVLGPFYGFAAAGIGSATADLLGGYFLYIPATLIIKGLVAFITGSFLRASFKKSSCSVIPVISGGAADIMLVAFGYLLFELPIYGASAAWLSLPANLVQGISGAIISAVMYPLLSSLPPVKQLISEMYFK